MPSARPIDAILSDLQLPTRTFPLSYTEAFPTDTRGIRVGLLTWNPQRPPDVTVIILNWSRLDNVIRIVSLLCGPWLDDTIAEVYVWNNSLQKLSKKIFSSAHCDTRKLKIENSPENLYFYDFLRVPRHRPHTVLSRCVAHTVVLPIDCGRRSQDDDYIVLPELIKALRVRVEGYSQGGIYLMPPHEHLSSRLRTTVTSNGIHTSFAWLGYGAMINRERALGFVSLLQDDSLGMTEEQIKMADNYFAILSNEIPEIWFDQGIELGGGQPFTERNERNRSHIENACRYLDEIVADPCYAAASSDTQIASLGFVKKGDHVSDPTHYHVNRAAAIGTPYLLESNIKLLPDDNTPNCLPAIDLLRNEDRRARLIGQDAILHYQQHPCPAQWMGTPVLRSAVLMVNVKQGDYILIDTLSTFEFNDSIVELVFLVAASNERILRTSKYECSSDGERWLLSPYQSLSRRATVVAQSTWDDSEPLEYSVRMAGNHARFFKATAGKDVSVPWVIYEVWVRSVSQIV